MKRTASILTIVLLLSIFVVPISGSAYAANVSCGHTDVLMCFSGQALTDERYSVDISAVCRECDALIINDSLFSPEKMDAAEYTMNVIDLETDIELLWAPWCTHTNTIEDYPQWTQMPCYRTRLVKISCRDCGQFLRNVEQRMETGHTGVSGSWRDGGHTSATVHYWYKVCSYDGAHCNPIYANCSGQGGHISPYRAPIDEQTA